MESGHNGAIGQDVLLLVVEVLRNDQEIVLHPSIMVDGVKETAQV